MAHLVRLIFLLLAVFCHPAHAVITPGAGYSCYAQSAPTWGTFTSASLIGCANQVVAEGISRGPIAAGQVATCPAIGNCGWGWPGGGYGSTLIRISAASICPANSTLSGGNCVCGSGYEEHEGACRIPVDPAEEYCASINGSPVRTSWSSTSMALTENKSVCQTGGGYHCQTTVETTMCAGGDAGSPITCYGSGTVTGGACTPPADPTIPTPPDSPAANHPSPPPPGTCPGEINGVTVNVPCKNTSTNSTTTSSSNDGAGNDTNKTESKATTCNAAGSCTTTTTTTTTVNGGSPTTTTNTTTQGKGEFCAANRGSAQCGDGEGSSFGGSCEASFQCTGDAVQCALTKEVHMQNCKLNKDTDESALYGLEKVKDGDQTGDLPGNETIPFGTSNYDDSDALGGGACIDDLLIENEWISANLPLSMACTSLAWFRYLLLTLGAFAWMLIVFRK